MTDLWLSVRKLLGFDSAVDQLDDRLMANVAGLHVDVFPRDSSSLSLDFVAELLQARPSARYDLHFINDRADAAALVREAKNRNSALRYVYGSRPAEDFLWAPSLTASEIASGSADGTIAGLSRILITAPPVERALIERVDLVQRAVVRALAVSTGTPDIVLDRDVDGDMANDITRLHVVEVVVGKAILSDDDPVKAAAVLRHTWGET